MNENEKKDFAELLTDVFSVYGKDVSAFSLDAFWATLRRFDFAAVKHAFNVHYGSPDKGNFAPRPGDIIRVLEGGSGDRALVAWTKVDRAVRTVGPHQSIVFDDPTIHAVIRDMGGWIQLGNCTEKDFEFRGKEFTTRYRGYEGSGGVKDFPSKLMGIAEMDNEHNKKPIDPPVLIGDTQRAQLILRKGGGLGAAKITRMGEITKHIGKQDGAA